MRNNGHISPVFCGFLVSSIASDLSAIDAAHAEELERVSREADNLRATIERQAAEMQARETAYMDALAAKSIRIDELATLIESLQTEIADAHIAALEGSAGK